MTSSRRILLPATGVFIAAPWFAEMAWGGIAVTQLPLVVLFLAPLYGSAALLIREVVRRTGRGWPSILLLAAAFAVLQAGVHVGGVDISLYWLLAFVSGHIVASISTPIALAEAWIVAGVYASRRRG